ncbi:MAG TPA: hypothetical protein ACFYD1_04235, partial [Candidatus Hypogeohydataceae bacterium YC38]
GMKPWQSIWQNGGDVPWPGRDSSCLRQTASGGPCGCPFAVGNAGLKPCATQDRDDPCPTFYLHRHPER